MNISSYIIEPFYVFYKLKKKPAEHLRELNRFVRWQSTPLRQSVNPRQKLSAQKGNPFFICLASRIELRAVAVLQHFATTINMDNFGNRLFKSRHQIFACHTDWSRVYRERLTRCAVSGDVRNSDGF